MASPPFATLKKLNPARRSSSSITFAIVREGSANTTENDVARMAHTNSGIRLSDMPGARSLRIVTMKLMDPTVVEIPKNTRPSV